MIDNLVDNYIKLTKWPTMQQILPHHLTLLFIYSIMHLLLIKRTKS